MKERKEEKNWKRGFFKGSQVWRENFNLENQLSIGGFPFVWAIRCDELTLKAENDGKVHVNRRISNASPRKPEFLK